MDHLQKHLLVGRWPTSRHSFDICLWIDLLTGLFIWMDRHLSRAHCCVTDQRKTSSHQLQIETGKYAHKPMEEWIWQLCHWRMELEECYDFHCGVF